MTTGDKPATDTRLAAFRVGDAAPSSDADHRPSETNDTTTALAPPADPAPRAPGDPEPAPAADPPLFADNARRAIAAKARAVRAAANPTGETDHIDKFNIPEGIRVEGDEDERLAEEERRASEAARVPARQPAPAADKTYNLRVYRNDIQVSREELLRYAGVEPAIADTIPEASLVALAQKQIAADANLEASRAANKSVPAAGTEPANQSESSQHPAAHAPHSQPDGLPAKSDEELMELVQLGEPAEAREAQRILNARDAARFQADQRVRDLSVKVDAAISDFAEKYPDIANDPDAADFHRGVLLREMSNELASKIPGLPDAVKARIATDQSFAVDVYKAAHGDGIALRQPAQLFEDSAAIVTRRLRGEGGDPPPSPPPGGNPRPEPSVPQSREDLKRGLFRQPGRSDSVLQQPPAQSAQGRRRDPSAVIRERFANRMNRG